VPIVYRFRSAISKCPLHFGISKLYLAKRTESEAQRRCYGASLSATLSASFVKLASVAIEAKAFWSYCLDERQASESIV